MAFIMVDADKCNQDGLCVFECPSQVLQIDPETDLYHLNSSFSCVYFLLARGNIRRGALKLKQRIWHLIS